MMIEVEGYKAFHGAMEIVPIGKEKFTIQADWLYKPEYDCWYCHCGSFPAKICNILWMAK